MPQDAEVHVQQKQPDFQPESQKETEQEGDKGNTYAPMSNQVKGGVPRYVLPTGLFLTPNDLLIRN
jgi:hypothetical protein